MKAAVVQTEENMVSLTNKLQLEYQEIKLRQVK
jgi:hypothetical protein